MAKGGVRKGAGRKKGSAHQKTREIANKLAITGITPLEVMTNVMREFYELSQITDNSIQRTKYLEIACNAAKDAAPYMHPRLSAIDVGNKDNKPFTVENKADEEVNRRILELTAKVGA